MNHSQRCKVPLCLIGKDSLGIISTAAGSVFLYLGTPERRTTHSHLRHHGLLIQAMKSDTVAPIAKSLQSFSSGLSVPKPKQSREGPWNVSTHDINTLLGHLVVYVHILPIHTFMRPDIVCRYQFLHPNSKAQIRLAHLKISPVSLSRWSGLILFNDQLT